MKTAIITRIALAVVVILVLSGSAWAATCEVIGYQKISDTEGNFNGILDDGDHFSFSMASLGDLDGDGITDIAVGALEETTGFEGALWILFLNADGSVKNHQKISENQGGFMETLNYYDDFGNSVTSLGDLDGDGVTDIAVGELWDDDGGLDRGAVWIFFLNSDGTVKNYQKISDTQGGFTGTLINAVGFGSSLTKLGDLDNDGVIDIAVGAAGYGGNRRGAVWILFLNSDGTVKSNQKISDTEGGFTGTLDDNDRFGTRVASLDDIDGDNVTDIAVGARFDDDGGGDTGAVWILFLNSNGTVKSHQKISDTEGNFLGILDYVDQFGCSVDSPGDLDEDGVNDLFVGANLDDDGGVNRGAVWILFLNSDGTVKSHQKISDTEGNFTGTLNDGDGFGQSLASLGDLNKDGFIDLAAGGTNDNDGGPHRGAVWILFLEKGFTYHVDGVNGSDLNDGLSRETAFETIQFAIDGANDCDTVLVWPGVYNETATHGINFRGKAITVKSASDAAVLEVPGFVAVTFVQGEDENSVFSNFVVRGSTAGIFALFANPTINNVTVVGNNNGVIADNANPLITNSIFWNNINGDLFGSPDPITAQYSFVQDEVSEPNMPAAGLISHWKLDEGAGPIAYDSAGTNDGTLYGSPNWISGISGTALDFDGVGERDYVLIAGQTGLLGGGRFDDITVEAWFKTSTINNTGPYAAIVADETTDGEFAIAVNEFGNAYGVIYMEGSTGAQLLYGPNATDGEWHNLCLRKDSSEVALFVDVTKCDTVASTGPLKVNQQTHVTLGCKYTTYLSVQFIGIIDEVAIYNRALSAGEIEQIYQPVSGPMFADAAGGDYHLLSERGRYRATTDEWILDDVTSPCIDGGEPSVNPSNEPMPNGGRINMGAYGNTAYASMSEWPIKGDINNDGRFNFMDIALLLDGWLQELPWAE